MKIFKNICEIGSEHNIQAQQLAFKCNFGCELNDRRMPFAHRLINLKAKLRENPSKNVGDRQRKQNPDSNI